MARTAAAGKERKKGGRRRRETQSFRGTDAPRKAREGENEGGASVSQCVPHLTLHPRSSKIRSNRSPDPSRGESWPMFRPGSFSGCPGAQNGPQSREQRRTSILEFPRRTEASTAAAHARGTAPRTVAAPAQAEAWPALFTPSGPPGTRRGASSGTDCSVGGSGRPGGRTKKEQDVHWKMEDRGSRFFGAIRPFRASGT